jgi:predicted PolB exonuclease-like 3'-5' exonuclease
MGGSAVRPKELSKPQFLGMLRTPKELSSGMTEKEWKEKQFSQINLNGNFGKILCIGYIKEEQPMKGTAKILEGNEGEILKEFWKLGEGVNLFVGHNILNFDLKFIWKRSVICKIKPTVNISFQKFRDNPVFDTMQEWEKWDLKNYTSLDTLAKALGFPSSKKQLDGSKVQDFYEKGKHKEIYEYCKADVELTRKIYYRMKFIS